MLDYLDEKQFGEVEAQETVWRLQELGLVDDLKYAKSFVSTRLASKAVSRRRLSEQLYSHGIKKEVIEEALAEVSNDVEAENARICAEKYLRQLTGLQEDERRRRVFSRLLRRGYDTDTIERAILEAGEGDSDAD